MTNNILEVQHVHVSFDGFTVLDDLNFSMEKGELRFLIGPNGAGKTTLLDIITGKTNPTAGHVIYDGTVDISRWSEHKIVQHGIGRKFQTPAVFGSLTVFENLESAVSFKETSLKLMGKTNRQYQQKIDETLEAIGLTDQVNLRAGLLSHGQKQWLEIGMLLMQEPRLLLLDEPIAGMTGQERQATGELVQRIAETHSVLVVEHDMDFVRNFANIVSVLHAGQLLCEGPMAEVQDNPAVIEVYLGEAHNASTINTRIKKSPRLRQVEAAMA